LSQQRSARFADRSKSGVLHTVQSVSCCRLHSGRPGVAPRTCSRFAKTRSRSRCAPGAPRRRCLPVPRLLRIAGLTALCNQSTPYQPVSVFTQYNSQHVVPTSGPTVQSQCAEWERKQTGDESGVREPGDAPRRRSAGPTIRSQEKQQALRSGEALDSESSFGRGQHGSAPGPAAALETSLEYTGGSFTAFRRGSGRQPPRENPSLPRRGQGATGSISGSRRRPSPHRDYCGINPASRLRSRSMR
jgi:hypothetical protein